MPRAKVGSAPVLPSAPDAELSLLAASLESRDAAQAAVEQLGPEAFFQNGRRLVFEAISRTLNPGQPADPISVKNELVRIRADKAAFDALNDAVGEASVPANFPVYIEILREKEYGRTLARFAGAVLEETANGSRREVLEELARSISRMQQLPEGTADAFVPVALNWGDLEAGGLPTVQFIEAPYIPEGGRVWVVGPAGSAKSVWSLWLACKLTREGLIVAYYSQENPLAEDVRRLGRLAPDRSRLRFYHHQLSPPVDLAQPDCIRGVIDETKRSGAALVIFDTLTACWSGLEDDNAAIAALDRNALLPLSRETGATTVILDHTGNPQAFVARRGVSAPRGASTKGQKTDVLLEFRPAGERRFRIEQAKARIGGQLALPATFAIVDTDDDLLDIVPARGDEEIKTEELAERMVEVIQASAPLSTKALRAAVGGGTRLQDAAMSLLTQEDPPRVRVAQETIEAPGGGGRQRAKAWRPADSTGTLSL